MSGAVEGVDRPSFRRSLERAIGNFVLMPLGCYIVLAGYPIVLFSDAYSAKEAIFAMWFPPYAWYVALTWPLDLFLGAPVA